MSETGRPSRRAFGLGVAGAAVSVLVAGAGDAAALAIVTRAQWRAKPALAGLIPQTPVGIVIHHTGVKAKPNTAIGRKMRGLQEFSQTKQTLANGKVKPVWPDVPYHFYISALGEIAEGRDPKAQGDTNTNYNPAGLIQIAIEGDFTSAKPAGAQTAATAALVAYVARKYGFTGRFTWFHNEKASTACPGKNLIAALEGALAGRAGK